MLYAGLAAFILLTFSLGSHAAAVNDTLKLTLIADWLELPGKFEIHEWDIMERFCQVIEDPEMSNRMLRLIRGSGAFRKARDLLPFIGASWNLRC